MLLVGTVYVTGPYFRNLSGLASLAEGREFVGLTFLALSVPLILFALWIVFFMWCRVCRRLRSEANLVRIDVDNRFRCFMKTQRME